MLDSGHEARGFLSDFSAEDLAQDRMRALSIVKCIEIIGEAASSISQETSEKTPDVPWRAIIAMRNRLVHGYFDIDYDRVVNTVLSDLPPLMERLTKLLNEDKA